MDSTRDLAMLSDPDGQLRSLKSSFQKVQSKLSDWMKNLDGEVEAIRARQLESIAKQQQAIDPLQQQIQALKNEQHLKKAASANLVEEMKQIDSAVECVQKETDSLLLRKENLLKQVSDMQATITQQRELLETQNAVTQQTTKELEKSIDFFRDRLGLQFKKVSGGRMQVIFTCIDYKEPNHPYYCFVKVNSERKYQVTDCTPEVDGFQELVDKLNRDNDFQSFMLALRKAFQATL